MDPERLRFLCPPPQNKPFSIIVNTVLSKSSRVFDSIYLEKPRKTSQKAGIEHKKPQLQNYLKGEKNLEACRCVLQKARQISDDK